MKKTLKAFYVLVSSLFMTLLNLPFAFAKPVLGNRLNPGPAVAAASSPMDSTRLMFHFKSVYDSLHLELAGLSRQAFAYAQKGWDKLVSQGMILNQSVMAIIDFSQPSDHKRLYVVDMKNYRLLYNTLVAHGRNSGKERAFSFSNRPASYKSSPGFYITGETYFGNNGYSLKLEGIEKGINDKAHDRAIVIHGASYVSESYIRSQGYIGRSEGCPAVPVREAGKIIDAIKNGACLFVYPGNGQYASQSRILR